MSRTNEKVSVRVREARALTLPGETGSTLYRTGDHLELPPGEADQLVEQGFVEPT